MPGVQRGHDDDRAPTPLERPASVLQARRNTPDVDREGGVECVDVEVGSVAPRWHDAGVRDHDVEPTEPLYRGRDGALDVSLERHVGRQRDPTVRSGPRLEIDDCADCAARGEGARDRRAEAAGAARDERDAAGEQPRKGVGQGGGVPPEAPTASVARRLRT